MIAFTVKTPALELQKIEDKLHNRKTELLLHRIRLRESGRREPEWSKNQKQLSAINVKLTVLKAVRQYQYKPCNYAS